MRCGCENIQSKTCGITTNSLRFLKATVLDGGCIGAMPNHIVQEEFARDLLRPIIAEVSFISLEARLISRASRIQLPAAHALQEVMKRVCTQI